MRRHGSILHTRCAAVNTIMWIIDGTSAMLLLAMANKAVSNYMRKLGRKGGKASWASLTPEQRSERARAMALSGTEEERKARASNAAKARAAKNTETV
jgi:hypothetical protein